MSHERDGQDDRKMLNLEIGGFYKIRCGQGGEYIGQVLTKSVHNESTHTYFFSWPDPKTPCAVGHYMWDTGMAKRGYDHFGYHNPIIKCRKLTHDEKFDLIGQFIKYNQQWKAFIVEPRKGKLRKDKTILWKTSDKVCYSTI